MFDWIKKNLLGRSAAADPYDQFVIEFIAECKRQACIPKSYNHQARAFVFSDVNNGEIQFQLGNVFGTWLVQDQNGRAELTSRFVRSIGEAGKNAALIPEQLPSELMPGVRPRVQISNTLLQCWIAGAPIDNGGETAWLPFVGGDLAACAIRSQPYTMSQLTHANLAFADLPIEQAMSRAMTNFRAWMPSPAFEPVGDGVFYCGNLEDHQSALLLLEPGKEYALPAIQGAPVALVPGRNLFFLTGSENLPGLTRLLDLAERAQQTPNFCSSRILRWDGDRWSEFPFEPDSINARRQREISLTQLSTDYGFQKQLLDQLHQMRGIGIFVANLMLYRKKDSEAVTSVTSLGSGTIGTFLPRADDLSFVKQIVDPNTGLAEKGGSDIASAPWTEAMDVVGHLFEPVAHLYPPRFRALGFPDDAAWIRLKALDPTHRP